ncbi:MAG: hypothetical protein ACP5UQ_07790 [Anaerolineae bacterium]
MSSQVTIPLIMNLLAAFWFAMASVSRKTDPGIVGLARVGGVLAVVLAAAIIVVIVLQVPISAAIVIPILVAVIVEFGFLIAYVARIASGRISQRTFLICILVIVAGILTGIVLMFQPWTLAAFNPGFDLVLISLLAFMIWSHITPRNGVTR